jgi:hypothetical protein
MVVRPWCDLIDRVSQRFAWGTLAPVGVRKRKVRDDKIS